jgi:hypothetical protein
MAKKDADFGSVGPLIKGLLYLQLPFKKIDRVSKGMEVIQIRFDRSASKSGYRGAGVLSQGLPFSNFRSWRMAKEDADFGSVGLLIKGLLYLQLPFKKIYRVSKGMEVIQIRFDRSASKSGYRGAGVLSQGLPFSNFRSWDKLFRHAIAEIGVVLNGGRP